MLFAPKYKKNNAYMSYNSTIVECNQVLSILNIVEHRKCNNCHQQRYVVSNLRCRRSLLSLLCSTVCTFAYLEKLLQTQNTIKRQQSAFESSNSLPKVINDFGKSNWLYHKKRKNKPSFHNLVNHAYNFHSNYAPWQEREIDLRYIKGAHEIVFTGFHALAK